MCLFSRHACALIKNPLMCLFSRHACALIKNLLMCLFSRHACALIKNPLQRYCFFLTYARKKHIISKFCAFLLLNFAVFRHQTLRHSTSKLCGIIRSFGANPLGNLVQIRSVIWRIYIRLFGIILFGKLACFHLGGWLNTRRNLCFCSPNSKI